MSRLIRVAPLAAADVSRYRALMLHAYTVEPDAFTSTAEERAGLPASWWIERLAHPTGLSQAFGAFHGDDLVGTVAVEFSAKPKTRHKAHLIGMFVDERARGLGAGKALMRAVLDHVKRRRDVRTITLTVTQGNTSAVALYNLFGFREFGVEPMAIASSGVFKSKVHMVFVFDEP